MLIRIFGVKSNAQASQGPPQPDNDAGPCWAWPANCTNTFACSLSHKLPFFNPIANCQGTNPKTQA